MTDVDQQVSAAPLPAASQPSPVMRPHQPAPRKRSRLAALRKKLTREKFIEWLKTMAVVVPLTIIIWIYAEREQIPAQPTLVDNVPVQLFTSDPNEYIDVSADPNHFVESPGGSLPEISLKLTGPEAGLERVRDQLTTQIPPQVLQIDLASSLRSSNQSQRVDVTSRIQNFELFKSNGVSVVETTPRDLLVLVDDVKSNNVDVQLPPGLKNIDAAATTIEPAKTTVRGPQRFLRGVSVFADLPPSVASLPPGVHTLSDLPLRLQGDSRVSILAPKKATVRLTVLAPDETYTLPNPVPVLTLSTQTLDLNFDKKVDTSVLTDVKVIGSHERIEQLRQEEAKGSSPVEAYVKLSTDDVGHNSKPVVFVTPDGIRISPDSADRTVGFTITPRGG